MGQKKERSSWLGKHTTEEMFDWYDREIALCYKAMFEAQTHVRLLDHFLQKLAFFWKQEDHQRYAELMNRLLEWSEIRMRLSQDPESERIKAELKEATSRLPGVET